MADARAPETGTDAPVLRVPRAWWVALATTFLVAAAVVYAPSFAGGPISDDAMYLMNPWVTGLEPGSLGAILDPRSQATLSLNNYAPVRAIAHAAQWALLYDETAIPRTNLAYHLTNIVAHVLASTLLACLLVQVGIAFRAAFAGAALFLLHPANVEAVAWLCELWTPLALAGGLAALLAQRRRPVLALVCFALALLTKPQAVCVLPVALLRQWSWRSERAPGDAGWGWMAGWLAVFVAITGAELAAFFQSASGSRDPIHPDLLVQARTIVALAGRYLVMAVTGVGVGAFQEPPAAVSWLDPWWLAGLGGIAAITGLALDSLRRSREEAAWWSWGPAAFLPVSQLLPFLYPFADRYLYFMLPGLIGAMLLASRRARILEAVPVRVWLVGAAVGCVVFGGWSHQRAGIWVAEDRVLADAAQRWPDGVPAHLLAARRAAQIGDVNAAIAHLELCRARGWDYYDHLLQHPAYASIRGSSRFQHLIREFAGDVIARASTLHRRTQLDLRDLAEAHVRRGELVEALRALDEAAALGGPIDPDIASRRAALRARIGDARR